MVKGKKFRSKPNLMVIGAKGMVANAFLLKLPEHRHKFGKLVLLDKKMHLRSNKNIDHKRLDYISLHKKIELPKKEKEFLSLLKRHKIDILIDLSTIDTIPILEALKKYNVAYMNTSMNIEEGASYILVFDLLKNRSKFADGVRILCSGMNPGVVNVWVRSAIEAYGVPEKVTFFEYDSSCPVSGWKPIITWSAEQFINESTIERSAVMLGGDRVKLSKSNAVMCREDMAKYFRPIMKMQKYPVGFTVPHEECASIAMLFNVPAKFVYSVHPKTMERLVNVYKKNGEIGKDDLILGDNTKIPLTGEDNIAVRLDYNDKAVYYMNSMRNSDQRGTNATCAQVAVGVMAGMLTLLNGDLEPRVYFTSELYGKGYWKYVAELMTVQRYVFKKTKGRLKLASHSPRIHQ